MRNMIKKTFVLSFHQATVQQPIAYHLIKDYNWIVNILRARITPNQEEKGMLVIAVQGKRQEIHDGLEYLTRMGVNYQPLAQDVVWDKQKCTHCTACISQCPTGALSVIRPAMEVTFDKEKCIACELCLKVCPYKAVMMRI